MKNKRQRAREFLVTSLVVAILAVVTVFISTLFSPLLASGQEECEKKGGTWTCVEWKYAGTYEAEVCDKGPEDKKSAQCKAKATKKFMKCYHNCWKQYGDDNEKLENCIHDICADQYIEDIKKCKCVHYKCAKWKCVFK